MIGIDIASLVVASLSLVATIAVSVVIFFVEQKHQKISRQKELKEKARVFIQDNYDEREYLPLAQFATVMNPTYRHNKKIYNNFCRCDIDLQKAILKEASFTDLQLEKYYHDEFVNNLLNLYYTDAKKLKLVTDDFLYDGAKNFHHGFYPCGSIRLSGNFLMDKSNNIKTDCYLPDDLYRIHNDEYCGRVEHDIWLRLLDFSLLQSEENKKDFHKRTLVGSHLVEDAKYKYSYIVPKNFDDFLELHEIAPLDYYWNLVRFTSVSTEECSYVVMEMIRQSGFIINREINKGNYKAPFEGEYQIVTNEDLYYCVVQELFALYFDKVFTK